MDDKLKAAIAAAYQRNNELIIAQNKDLDQLNGAMFGKVRGGLYPYLREAIYQYYKKEFELLDTQIKTLEAVRDAS